MFGDEAGDMRRWRRRIGNWATGTETTRMCSRTCANKNRERRLVTMDTDRPTEDACEEEVEGVCDVGEGEGEVEGEDIPFELVGEVAGARAVAEAGHVESLTAARHGDVRREVTELS